MPKRTFTQAVFCGWNWRQIIGFYISLFSIREITFPKKIYPKYGLNFTQSHSLQRFRPWPVYRGTDFVHAGPLLWSGKLTWRRAILFFHSNLRIIFHWLHSGLTPISHSTIKLSLITNKGGFFMLFDFEWYWWLIIAAVLIVSVPVKIKFMKWWNRRQQEQKKNKRGKWGDEEWLK